MNLLEPTKISFKNKKNEKTTDEKTNVKIKIDNDFNRSLLSRSKFTKKYFYIYLVYSKLGPKNNAASVLVDSGKKFGKLASKFTAAA